MHKLTPFRGLFLCSTKRTHAHIASVLHANQPNGKSCHFHHKVQHSPSSCKWWQIRACANTQQGPVHTRTRAYICLLRPPPVASNSRHTRGCPTINAKRTGEELCHFLSKIGCGQSSCIWEAIRIQGLVRTRTRAY